ncbi:hypothetical protein P170DRAFT_488566 [Aspergillus steynii IBT 23096]|uniref:Transcription factor domain-containing protein n=1 Tax=Aspergillus steynii IBT 23096 TaxID=1392250 RepID=A0A2I2GGT8_9EURO|nr:uncharacterized protein P170DRAFT_488566 [Aspergillus steynii IBT 23096]PLB52090.1 hypothetical protein P170DRAFT_488566 [Aspergillus steynii IBT 23096]
MAPLSPIISSFYETPQSHYWLVTQEPMLCCTILMISSRYHILPGAGGTSRGYFIHTRLWQHCQHLILRITLGQEKTSKAKTRHLSSIEALLLILEWYPRALHFPPETDGWDSDLALLAPDWRDPPVTDDDLPMSNRWKEDVVEPTKRSDRMSWMLVSNALALAHELGVFGQGVQTLKADSVAASSETDAYVELLDSRRRRLPLLLFVLVNLIAARIGCPSLLPATPGVSSMVGEDRDWVCFMTSWVELTRITKEITEQYFPPLRNDERSQRWNTTASLGKWRTVLSKWLTKGSLIDRPFDDILYIETEYLRVFINSIEMQSFVEENVPQSDLPSQANTVEAKDCLFLTEVVEGSCAILDHIVLRSTEQAIRYLPNRIFLRVISCSIFLLKALSLGTRAAALRDALNLLDKAIDTIQSDCPDDIHLVSRYAALLQIHVSRVRQTFSMSGNNIPNMQSQEEQREEDPGGELPQATDSWDQDMGLPDSIFSDDWLSLPLDPLMAPFGAWDETGQLDGLDSAYLDLDFIWNLPP